MTSNDTVSMSKTQYTDCLDKAQLLVKSFMDTVTDRQCSKKSQVKALAMLKALIDDRPIDQKVPYGYLLNEKYSVKRDIQKALVESRQDKTKVSPYRDLYNTPRWLEISAKVVEIEDIDPSQRTNEETDRLRNLRNKLKGLKKSFISGSNR